MLIHKVLKKSVLLEINVSFYKEYQYQDRFNCYHKKEAHLNNAISLCGSEHKTKQIFKAAAMMSSEKFSIIKSSINISTMLKNQEINIWF